MVYEQETLALQLYDELTSRFAAHAPAIGVAIAGVGIHWHCTVRSPQRSCRIECYSNEGPHYYIDFNEDDTRAARGWTRQSSDIHAAAQAWMTGKERSHLYTCFAFVDRTIRALMALETALVALCPDLTPLVSRHPHDFRDVYDLSIRTPCRACRIAFFGDDDSPQAHFSWDDCTLFHVHVTSTADLAPLLRRWLLEHAMPTALEQEFPWLSTGQLARYYEEGRGIEGEFLLSWDSIERYYTRLQQDISPVALAFIAEIRQAGYDHTLRAGQSMWTLMVSRARHHGLSGQQPRIRFDFDAETTTMDVTVAIGTRRILTGLPAVLTPEITDLLTQLTDQEIE